MNNNRFSRRWSTFPDRDSPSLKSTVSQSSLNISPPSVAHISSNEKPPLPRSYSSPPRGSQSQQRWSTVPTMNSRLSMVETITYDNDENESVPLATPQSSLERSKAHLREMMRLMFSGKEKDAKKMLVKTSSGKAIKSSKRNETTLKGQQKKEAAWSRLSIIIRPPKPATQGGAPKRVDSGVDIPTLKKNDEERHQQRNSRNQDEYSSPSIPTLQPPRSLSQPAAQLRNRNTLRSSTTLSLPVAPPKLLTLSPAETAYLLSQLRHAQALLTTQSHSTEAFSKNLAGLLWSKEYAIKAQKLLPESTKSEMLEKMSKVREQTSKTFCKKGIYLDRSMNVLDRVIDVLEGTREADGSAKEKSAEGTEKGQVDTNTTKPRSPSLDSTTSRSTSQSDSSSSTDSNATLVNPANTTSTPAPTISISHALLTTLLSTLKADLTAHSHLDPALRNTVVQPTQEPKYLATENEKIAMKRFTRFVDGRIKVMGAQYWEWGRWVRGLEGWVDDLVEAA